MLPLPLALILLAFLVLASAVSRSARFFLEGFLLNRYGPPVQGFIERNLGWLSLLFVALLLGGFLLLRH